MMAKLKHIILLLTGICPISAAHPQIATPTSLKETLTQAKSTKRVDALNAISLAYYTGNTDSAFLYAHKAYDESIEIGYWQGKSDGLNNMGAIMRERGNLDSAEACFRSAFVVSGAFKGSPAWCRDHMDLGNLFFLKGNYGLAADLVNEALSQYRLDGNKNREDYCCRMLGTIFTCQGYYEKAFSYFQKSFAIGREVNDSMGSHSSSYMWNTYLLGSLYREAGDTITSLQYYRLSLARAAQNNSMVDYYQFLGDISSMKGQSDSAIYYYSREVHFNRERIPDPTIARTFETEPLMEIGEIYMMKKK